MDKSSSSKNKALLETNLEMMGAFKKSDLTRWKSILENYALPSSFVLANTIQIPAAIKQAQEMTAKWTEFSERILQLKQNLQFPLALNALSNSLGMENLISSISFKLTEDILPKVEIPNLDFSKYTFDWDAINARDEKALRFAALHNWFIQPETEFTFAADIDACKGDSELLDQMFSSMIRQYKSEIMLRLVQNFPTFAPLIDEMNKLHVDQRYLASIPLALIVAEGIAREVSSKSIFNLKQNRPEIAKWLDQQKISSLGKTFVASLSEQHPMSKPRPGKLSRHLVLHGLDKNYGSEIFSLQAISILGFVGWVFAADGLIRGNDN